MKKTYIYPTTAEYDKEFWDSLRMNKPMAVNQLNDKSLPFTGAFPLPESTAARFHEALSKDDFFRRIATVMHAPALDSTVCTVNATGNAEWVPEGGTIPEDDDAIDTFGFEMYKLASITKIHTDLIRDMNFDLEGYIVSQFARRFGKAEEDAFLNGDGNGCPTGILSPTGGADVGITAESSAAISFDEVMALFHSLKPEYRENAVWVMNDTTALALRTLKDSAGNYLWNECSPDLLTRPVVISNSMPDIGSGKKPIAFGDFSYYWIVERMPLTVRPLYEKYIMSQLRGYIGYENLDGKLIRSEAIKVIQMAE